MNEKIVFKFDRTARLRCDSCGNTSEEKVEVSYDHVGSKCPKCGAIWCTKEDVDAMMRVYEGMESINKMFGNQIGTSLEDFENNTNAVSIQLDSKEFIRKNE